MVAAFSKLGIPTMMSARPSRAISSRTAGLRAVAGTSSAVRGTPRHRTPNPPTPASALRDRRLRPALVGLAGDVAAVGVLVGERAESERSPGVEPDVDRRPDVDSAADPIALDDH